jgi:hypothetical protein
MSMLLPTLSFTDFLHGNESIESTTHVNTTKISAGITNSANNDNHHHHHLLLCMDEIFQGIVRTAGQIIDLCGVLGYAWSWKSS